MHKNLIIFSTLVFASLPISASAEDDEPSTYPDVADERPSFELLEDRVQDLRKRAPRPLSEIVGLPGQAANLQRDDTTRAKTRLGCLIAANRLKDEGDAGAMRRLRGGCEQLFVRLGRKIALHRTVLVESRKRGVVVPLPAHVAAAVPQAGGDAVLNIFSPPSEDWSAPTESAPGPKADDAAWVRSLLGPNAGQARR